MQIFNMPKEIQITKYACNVCGYHYSDYSVALMCESATMIPEHIVYNPGDTFEFDCEDDVTSSRSMSTFETGTVLAKIYLTNRTEDKFFEHHIAYVVKYKVDGDDWEERIVFWVKGVGEGNKNLYSAPQFHYKKNYHQNMPSYLKVIGQPSI